MRWLFLFVLASNLAYIIWQISLPASDSYVAVQSLNNNVPPIVLLSELRNKDQPGLDDQVATQTPRQSADIAADAPSVADQAGAEPVVAVALVEEKTPEIVPESESANEVPETVAGEAGPEKSSHSGGCYTLGPFRDLDTLRSLTREIKSYVVAADFRGREEKEQPLYWVYIKPEKNIEKAMEVGERLKANKIKDFYIIREGEKNNGISLGYFRNKDRAFRLAKKATKLGFAVQADPVFKTYTVYWLDYELAEGVSIPEAIFDKYIRSGKTDEVSRLGRDCGT
jgi:hypothetical protein